MAAKTPTARDLSAEVAFLTRALKAPTLRASVTRLAERARAKEAHHMSTDQRRERGRMIDRASLRLSATLMLTGQLLFIVVTPVPRRWQCK
jgi:hypothetical protein